MVIVYVYSQCMVIVCVQAMYGDSMCIVNV